MRRLHNLRQILTPPFHSTDSQREAASLGGSTCKPSLCSSAVAASHPQARPLIQVSPHVSQFDSPVRVRASGLPPHCRVTLQGWLYSRWQRRQIVLVSYGHFYTDQNGCLDLTRHPSLGGTYKGVDPMGLLWSMGPLPHHPQDVRLVVRDVTQPLEVHLALFKDHVAPDDHTLTLTSGEALTSTTFKRSLLAPGVRRVVVREGRLRGTLFLPPGEGPFPGVLDMFGAAGGLMEIRAALLASHGFAALALALFRYEDLPTDLTEVQIDYLEEAVGWLSGHSAIRGAGIGVVGVSSGAVLSLQLAVQCPEVKAVVAINGHPFHILYDMLRHNQLLFSRVPTNFGNVKLTDQGVIIKNIYVPVDSDFFPAWKNSVRVLCLVSEDDQQVDPNEMDHLRQLYPPDKRHLISVVRYPDAGHLLEAPYNPHCRFCYTPINNGNAVWGGEKNAHALAQEDAWRRLLTFLHTWLPPFPSPHPPPAAL